MTMALGIFDLFTYAIPGALQLALIAYLLQRLQWLDMHALGDIPSGILFVCLALSSYLLGHFLYAVGWLIDRVGMRERRWGAAKTREIFLARNPTAHAAAICTIDAWVLKAAVELQSREAAVEIGRFRATGLMLRNSVVPLALGAITAGIEAIDRAHRPFALAATAFLAITTVIATRRSFQLRSWAHSYALQLAYWNPDIDRRIASHDSTPPNGADALDLIESVPS